MIMERAQKYLNIIEWISTECKVRDIDPTEIKIFKRELAREINKRLKG